MTRCCRFSPCRSASGETTVLRMVSAYSVLANGGKQIKPSMIDRIQDRYGKTIFRHEERTCDNCNAADWKTRKSRCSPTTASRCLTR